MTIVKETGVLVLHTGSPDSPEPEAVRAYLQRFLMDPDVLVMPGWLRWMLVKGMIAPLRARSSAAKYRAVWMPEGAPLEVLTHRFVDMLRCALPGCAVVAGAAYSEPTVADGFLALVARGVRQVVVLPMFPHDAGATRGSLDAAVTRALQTLQGEKPVVVTVPPFYEAPGYIAAMTRVAAPLLSEFRAERVVFSYHGLPIRQAHESRNEGRIPHYEAQCRCTTAVLARALRLSETCCVQAYQSRFGRGWLAPTLEDTLTALVRDGYRRVAVLAPSFVTDCLETLEELDIRAGEQFVAAGGEALLRVPALNDHPAWVDAAATLVREVANVPTSPVERKGHMP